jgi:hypothetical protein
MIFDNETDWKELLREEDQQVLAELFDKAKDKKCAYCQADDVKVAQLWSAMIELKKELNEQKAMISRVEQPFRAIVEMGEIEKKKTVERLVRELLKPEPDQEEATKKLVDSLMKF